MTNLAMKMSLKEHNLIDRTIQDHFKYSYKYLNGRTKVNLYKVIEFSESYNNISLSLGFMANSNVELVSYLLRDKTVIRNMVILSSQERLKVLKSVVVPSTSITLSIEIDRLIMELIRLTEKIENITSVTLALHDPGILHDQYIIRSFEIYEDIAYSMQNMEFGLF